MNKLTLVVVAVLAAAGCKDKAAGKKTAGETLAKMRELTEAMCTCKDATCAQDVSDKMTKWSQEQAKEQTEPPKMSDVDQKMVAELGEKMGKCLQNAMAAAPAAEPPPAGSAAEGSAANAAAGSAQAGSAAPAVGPDGLPVECADYKVTVEKLKTCDKFPQKARDALVKGYQDAAAGWVHLPEAAKLSLNRACKAGTRAVVDAAKEACGW